MGIKKGFLFTLLALLIIAIFVLSLQLWAQQKNIETQIAAKSFEFQSAKLPLNFISQSVLQEISKVCAYYAINYLSEALINHPEPIYGIKYNANNKNDPEGIYFVNSSLYELMVFGNTSGYLVDSLSNNNPRGYFYNINNVKSNLTYSPNEKKYTLLNYFVHTSKLAKQFGYELTWGAIENFNFSHLDYKTLAVSFYLPVKLEGKNLFISKKIFINFTIPIHGLADPYPTLKYRQNYFSSIANPNIISFSALFPRKNVYFSEAYPTSADASAKLVISGSQGLGWFYGPVTTKTHTQFSNNDPIYNISKIDQFIFATNNPDLARREADYFGAIILYGLTPYFQTTTNNQLVIISEEQNCFWCVRKTTTRGVSTSYSFYKYPNKRDIPFIIIPYDINYVLNKVNPVYNTGLKEVLISSDLNISNICSDYKSSTPTCGGEQLTYKNYSKSKASIYDLNGPRDMALCGFYVPSDYGFSYLQRFTSIGYNPNNFQPSKFGIESFEVGVWAGGYFGQIQYNLPQKAEFSSRLDYHFFNFIGNTPVCYGVFIKGMPGCKNQIMLNSLDPYTSSSGRFVLSYPSTNRYKLDLLTLPLPPGLGGVSTCN
jgi:hypothetical protein